MEINLPIYTYGYIDAMFYALNGVAMLINSAFGQGLLMLTVMISAVYYAVLMSYAGNNFKTHVGQFLGMIAMVCFLISFKTDMVIFDHVAKKKEKVDNLPVGFAVSVGILETFGDMLTAGFEQAFTPITNTSYRDYGMVFGARLVQESRNWRIRSPEFMENMSNFMDRCVMVDLMIGYYYTPEKLLKTDDMWGMVSENIGSLRQVPMRLGQEKVLMSCEKAVKEVLEPAFKIEVESLNKRYSTSQYAEAGDGSYKDRNFKNINSNFKKNIELSFKSYVGTNVSAEKLIRQQMMINAMKNYADEYGLTRAMATQESNWRIAGDLAGTYLPILMSVLKVLVYSSFIFMVPLLVMSGGWGRYLKYLTLVASFQLWAPLNAVLNMFIDIYSSSNLLGIADNIVSFSTMSRIGNYTDKIVAVASGLQMSIPFLAFGIIQGGVGSFIHLAGNITGASQAAASQAANESVTGNKSFDNYSTGNQQLYNKSGFKTDWNESYASGGSSRQLIDGSMEKVTAGGNTLVQSGVGFTTSSGNIKFTGREGASSQLSQNLSENAAMITSDQRSLGETQRSAEVTAANFVNRIAQAESAGHKIDYSTLGDQAEEVRQAVSQARHMNQNYSYGNEQAVTGSGNMGLSGGVGTGGMPGISAGASAGIGTDVRLSNSSNQEFTDGSQLGRESSASINYSSVAKALSSEEFARTNNLDTSYSQDLTKNFEQQKALEKSISMRQEQGTHYSNALNHVQSKDASWEQDLYHQLESKVAKTYGVSTQDAHKMIERNDNRVTPIRRDIENRIAGEALAQVSHGKSKVSGEGATQALDDFSNHNSKKIDTNPSQSVKEHATSRGLNTDVNNLENKVLTQKVDTMLRDNKGKIDEARVEHQNHEAVRQNKINTLEQNRIGQGKVGKLLGIGGKTNPSTVNSDGVKSTITKIGKINELNTQQAEQITSKKKR